MYRYEIILLDGKNTVQAIRPTLAELLEFAIALDEEHVSWVVYDKLRKKTLSRDECFAVWEAKVA